MDVYIVLDGARVVDVSAKLQGAELIRATYARHVADTNYPDDETEYRRIYDRVRIINTDVKDMDR